MTHSDLCKMVCIDLSAKKIHLSIIDNGTAFRQNGSRFHYGGEDGFPDCSGYDNTGRAIYVECKLFADTVKSDQRKWLNRAASNGCACYIAKQLGHTNDYELIPWNG